MFENDESAIAIGKRLKHLRLISGLNRYELAEKAEINKSTISLWENAKSSEGKPTRKSIGKLLDAFKETGVVCSENWLLTGTGPLPNTTKEGISDFQDKKLTIIENFSESIDQQSLKDELKLFLNNTNAVIHQIKNNYMYPIFNAGDIIGGIWQSSNTITDETICIVKIDENLQVRRVKKGVQEGSFNVSYLVYDTDQLEPFEINNLVLKEVAPVKRLWRV